VTALNRTEFISQLKRQLRKLPFDEIKEAVDYYEQYFDDAGAENEQTVLLELGSPAAVASEIIAAFAVKDVEKKRGLSKAWMAILAAFASPLITPFALVVIILAVILVVLMVAIVIAVGGTGVSLILTGIASLVTSVPIAGQGFPTALFFFGLGLTASGIGLAIITGTVQLAKKSFNKLAKGMGKFVLRRKKK